MTDVLLKSETVNDILATTHNDYKIFTLRQGNNFVTMTAEQFRQLASLVPLPDLETSGYGCVVKEKTNENTA